MTKNEDLVRSGERSAMQGFSMHPPATIRKKAERDAWEAGWLKGKRKRVIALDGLEPVTAGCRTSVPTINLKNAVVWRDERAGKDYDTPEKARLGMERAQAALDAIESITTRRTK